MTRPAQHGPRLEPDGGVTFRLWAPAAVTVDLVMSERRPMRRGADGWFELFVPSAGPGTRYRFRIDGDLEVPDPASAFQPDDVSGPSEVIDHAHEWKAAGWRGRPWAEAVTLELHVGTFTEEGTFRAAIERLDEVVVDGFTAVELMPVADFPGRWNWGYDGVLPFAPDSSYGRPDDLKALVDAAHMRGLMVFLDVVYNHFGPEGNFLARYAPAFFADDASTPWGAAIDFTVPEVRDFVVENALHWLAHYRFDGLRLDAVHAIVRHGEPPLLETLSHAVGDFAAATGRAIHLILENDANSARLLDPDTDPPRGKYRAQWNDDVHHAWHVLLTGETQGYYRDYAADPVGALLRALESGFTYQGEASAHRGGAARGEPSGGLPPTAFVAFLQNHDQIGNRPRGERLDALAKAQATEAALTVTLLAPMPPLMFMGEAWGSLRPFPFFCDFHGALADAVRSGRRAEFAEAYSDPAVADSIPDPLAAATFRDAKLDLRECETPDHARRRDFIRRLLAARREHVVPLLRGLRHGKAGAVRAGDAIAVKWELGDGILSVLTNLSDRAGAAPLVPAGRCVWGERPDAGSLPPWSVAWFLEQA